MNKRIVPFLAVFLSIISLNSSHAQREADNWYYGFGAGLNFYTSVPRPLKDSPMESYVASAIISDKLTGEVLFFSDGNRVWNRNRQVMPNSTGLPGNGSTNQGALIVPVPAEDSLYYLFTLSGRNENEDTIHLSWSMVDMRLDSGRGDVVTATKNTLLLDNVAEKLTVIPHASEDAYWLMTHGIETDTFYVFRIDTSGIAPPQKQAIGPVLPWQDYVYTNGTGGCLKASPDGTMVAMANQVNLPVIDTLSTFELFDFDAETGELSDHRNLGSNFVWAYGVSFSPDNTKLYFTGENYPERSLIHQFDLNAPDIKASRVGFSTVRYFGGSLIFPALELAPDGKIYYTFAEYDGDLNAHNSFLCYINHPNRKGDEIDIAFHQIDYGEGNRSTTGLPNFMQHYFRQENIRLPGSPEAHPCSSDGSVKLYPNPAEDKLTIEIRAECLSPYYLHIYTVDGKLLREGRISSGSVTVDVSTLASGTYILRLTFEDRVLYRRFIVF